MGPLGLSRPRRSAATCRHGQHGRLSRPRKARPVWPQMLGRRCCWATAMLLLPSSRIVNKNYNFDFVFGQFPTELGPETPLKGPGSENGAEITHN